MMRKLLVLFLVWATAHGEHCTFPENSETIVNDGDLIVRQAIHPIDETVTVQLEYQGEAWLGFGYGERMIGTVAVIGLPEQDQVLKHDLQFGAPRGVPLVEDERQTLTQTSITQENGVTILTFTKPMVEMGETNVTAGANPFIWAIGQGNNLTSTHNYRGASSVEAMPECILAEPPSIDSSSSGGPSAGGTPVFLIVCVVFLVSIFSLNLCRKKCRKAVTNRSSYRVDSAANDGFKNVPAHDSELL